MIWADRNLEHKSLLNMSNFCKPEKGKEVLFLSNGSIEFGYYYLLLLSVLKTEFLFDLIYIMCQNSASNNF